MSASRNHWLLSVRPAFVASYLKRLLRLKRRVVQTAQGRFFVDRASNFGNAIVTHPPYEPQMVESLTSLLRKGDVFLDVGANEGYFSIIASKLVGDSGLVLCIEPQSRLQEVLFRNLAENSAFNVQVLQLAISDTRGTANICLLPDTNTGGSGLFRTARYAVPTQLVPQTTLSHLVGLLRTNRIRLMKIDIEGFEYEAILGSKGLFAGDVIEHIALELHPSILAARGKSAAEIVAFLRQNGYEQNTSHPTLVMSKTPGPTR